VAASAFLTSTVSTADATNPSATAQRRLRVVRLGTIGYARAWELQRNLGELRRAGALPDTLLLLEHPNTYTLGRRGNQENILLDQEELERRGIELHTVDRGGDVTYHGPGQLVGYPIFQLPPERLDYVRYIRDLERALLASVRSLGVPAHLQDGFSGVWVGSEKLCAIGVKIDAWGVTSHGFALNVNVDLEYFKHIIPCGIVDKGVTSLERLLNRHVSMRRVQRLVIDHIAVAFGLEIPKRATTIQAIDTFLDRFEANRSTRPSLP
jgi:lipoyl(octanoyl) transferase